MDQVTHNPKDIIILAAFGTSVPEAQQALEDIDTRVRETYPSHEIRWAFTSNFIIRKLRRNGCDTLFRRKVPLKKIEELYDDLKAEGITKATLQSLHVAPGSEYNDLINTPTAGIDIRFGKPLLADLEKIGEFADVLSENFGASDEVTILCGHGNDKIPEYNNELLELDKVIRKRFPNTFLATVEGQPGTEKAFTDAKATRLKKVVFVPVMITAGDHIMNDVMGDDEDSWKSRLGMQARAIGGMGANPKIVSLFLDRLAEAMRQ